MKSRHANSGPTRTHQCSRCRKHRGLRKMQMFQKKSGKLYALCSDCAKVRMAA